MRPGGINSTCPIQSNWPDWTQFAAHSLQSQFLFKFKFLLLNLFVYLFIYFNLVLFFDFLDKFITSFPFPPLIANENILKITLWTWKNRPLRQCCRGNFHNVLGIKVKILKLLMVKFVFYFCCLFVYSFIRLFYFVCFILLLILIFILVLVLILIFIFILTCICTYQSIKQYIYKLL